MLLEVHHLSRVYKEKRGLLATGFNVEEGELIAVVGHNGAGKSTLLKQTGPRQEDRIRSRNPKSLRFLLGRIQPRSLRTPF